MFALRPEAYRSDDIGLHVNLGRQSLLFQDGLDHRRFRKLMTPTLDLEPTQEPPAPMFAGISLSPRDGVPVIATKR